MHQHLSLQMHQSGSVLCFQPPTAEDLALICFTSGTTGNNSTTTTQPFTNVCFPTSCLIMSFNVFSGNPKGAMLTHGNVIANTAAFLRVTQVNKPSRGLTLKFRAQLIQMFRGPIYIYIEHISADEYVYTNLATIPKTSFSNPYDEEM